MQFVLRELYEAIRFLFDQSPINILQWERTASRDSHTNAAQLNISKEPFASLTAD